MRLFPRHYGRAKPGQGAQIDTSHPLAQGLVGLWLFNEGSGSVVNDLVRPNRGAIRFPNSATTWNAGDYGIAGNVLNGTRTAEVGLFSGHSAKVATPAATNPVGTVPYDPSFNLLSGFTIAYLYRRQTNFENVLGKPADTGNPPASSSWDWNINTDNTTAMSVKIGANQHSVDVSAGAGWYHCVARIRSDEWRFWLNGGTPSVFTTTIGLPANAASADLNFGGFRNDPGNNPFTGSFGFVQLWGRTLSDDDCLSLFSQPYQMIGSPVEVWRRVFLFGVPASGTTGTVSASLSSLAAASAGIETFTGTSAPAASSLAASAAGWVQLTGTVNGALSPLAAASTATEVFTGSAASAASSLTAAAVATEIFTGTASPSLSSFASALAGWIQVTGSVAATLSSLAAAAAGAETFTGTTSPAVSALALTAAGWIQITGSVTAALSPLAAAATASELFTGSVGAALQSLALSAAGAIGITGTAAAGVSPLAVSAVASEVFTGAISALLSSLSSQGTGVSGNNTSGTVGGAISSLAAASAGLETFTGSASPAASALAAAAAAAEAFTGAAAATVSPLTASGAGTLAYIGSAAAAFATIACASAGSEAFIGVVAGTVLQVAIVAAGRAGSELIGGTVSLAMSPFTVASTAFGLPTLHAPFRIQVADTRLTLTTADAALSLSVSDGDRLTLATSDASLTLTVADTRLELDET